jgi:hypothetical protein
VCVSHCHFGGADVGHLGQGQHVVEARLGGEVEDAFGVVSGGFIDPAAAPRRCAGAFELGALYGKAHLGKAQEDQAEDGAGVFLCLEAGIGAELIGGIPQALFQRGVVVVLFGWGDPKHSLSR